MVALNGVSCMGLDHSDVVEVLRDPAVTDVVFGVLDLAGDKRRGGGAGDRLERRGERRGRNTKRACLTAGCVMRRRRRRSWRV